MVGVRKNLFDESSHVGIVGHVVDPGAITSGPYQPGQPQLGQMLRDPGGMGPHERSKLIDRMLAVEESPNDAETGLVPEEFQHPHGVLELILGRNHIYLRSHAGMLSREDGGRHRTRARARAGPGIARVVATAGDSGTAGGLGLQRG